MPGSVGNAVELWDTATGRRTSRLAEGTSNIMSIAWSPDGKRLAVGHAYKLEIFDVGSSKPVRSFVPPGEDKKTGFWSVRWSPNGRQIAAVNPRQQRAFLWNADTLEVLKTWDFPRDLDAVAFSPDGSRLAVGGNFLVRIHDITSFSGTLTVAGVEGSATSVAFSPDGKTLAAGINFDRGAPKSQVRLWNTATGELVDSLEPRNVNYTGVAFSPDGKTLARGGSGGIDLWDLAAKRLRATLASTGTNGRFYSISSDGKFLITADRRICVWDMATGLPRTKSDAHESIASGVVCLPDGKRAVSAGGDRTIRYWDLVNGKLLRTVIATEQEYGILAFAASHDGKMLASGDDDGAIGLWDTESGKSRGKLRAAKRSADVFPRICTIDFSPVDNELVSGGFDATLRLWDLKSRTPIQSVVCEHEIARAKFSPDGKQLAWAEWHQPVRLWNVPEWKEARVFPESAGLAYLAPFDHGAGLAYFAPFDSGSNGREIFTQGFPAEHAAAGPTDKSEPRRRILRSLTCDKGDEVWSTAPVDQISVIVVSPNGRMVATSSFGRPYSIRVWSAKTGKLLLDLKEGHADTIRAMAFTPDSSRLVSASQDTTLLVWDVEPVRKLADAEDGK